MKRFLLVFAMALSASASYAEVSEERPNDGLDCMMRCISLDIAGSTCEKMCGG